MLRLSQCVWKLGRARGTRGNVGLITNVFRIYPPGTMTACTGFRINQAVDERFQSGIKSNTDRPARHMLWTHRGQHITKLPFMNNLKTRICLVQLCILKQQFTEW